MAYSLIDPDLMFSITRRLLGAWGILTIAQWLSGFAQWAPGGALGWDLHRIRQSRLYGGNFLAGIFRPRRLRILLCFGLAASLIVAIAPLSWGSAAALSIMIATFTLLNLRATGDGADKMAMVVAYGVLLQSIGVLTELPLLKTAGVFWIGGQLALAYATSGIAKIMLPGWRKGDVPRRSLSSYIYGHRAAHAVIARPGVAIVLAWFVIFIESLFPLALISPLPVLVAVLGILAVFHFATAILMGLNTYPLAFISAYPSLLLLAQWLNAIIYSHALEG